MQRKRNAKKQPLLSADFALQHLMGVLTPERTSYRCRQRGAPPLRSAIKGFLTRQTPTNRAARLLQGHRHCQTYWTRCDKDSKHWLILQRLSHLQTAQLIGSSQCMANLRIAGRSQPRTSYFLKLFQKWKIIKVVGRLGIFPGMIYNKRSNNWFHFWQKMLFRALLLRHGATTPAEVPVKDEG